VPDQFGPSEHNLRGADVVAVSGELPEVAVRNDFRGPASMGFVSDRYAKKAVPQLIVFDVR
jgi:hypothetical protein